ncbi:MAG TPA: VanZ family protein [Saprospiraceae bacterium]|nr:VanZ family protein [Saprospiraceae bacterium]
MQAQKTSIYWLLAAVLYSAFLVYVSLVNPESLPESELLSYDKLLHFGAYAVQTFLLAKAFVKKLYIHFIATVVGCLTLGLSLEWAQGFMRQGRSFEYLDMAANALGVAFGSFIYLKQLNLERWISH